MSAAKESVPASGSETLKSAATSITIRIILFMIKIIPNKLLKPVHYLCDPFETIIKQSFLNRFKQIIRHINGNF